jgi:hypothetical protein
MGERRIARLNVRVASVALVAALATACAGSSGEPPSTSRSPSPAETSQPPSPTEESPSQEPVPTIEIPPVDGPYDWTIDPADFVTTVDNPYFPLTPGTIFVFAGTSEGEREEVTVRVTGRTKVIQGVTCVVVRDTVRTGGEVTEDTFDWYAQDVDGNVWYMGEDTKEYDRGEVVSTEGSWEGGVHGALPGVIMPADPMVGLAYTQEHYAGQAEDKGKIVALGRQVSVPYGSFDDVLVTEDWTPLEQNVLERKSYAPGIGVVFEELVKGGQEVLRLVEVRTAA